MSVPTATDEPTSHKEGPERSLPRLVAQIGLSHTKNITVEEVRSHFRVVEAACSVEPDTSRRTRLLEVLPLSRTIHEFVHRLHNCHCGTATQPEPKEVQQLAAALDCIVRASFEDEYRKVQVTLGFVDAVADLVIMEAGVYGMEKEEHRGMRRIMGNILTNLSYGNTQSKKKLCAHAGFLATVTQIVEHNLALSQVFGGLIRNLSWMADAQMVTFLAGTVPALAKSAVRAGKAKEEKCLLANLSALWNLASHSTGNKKSMCETDGFLKLLVSLLTKEPQQTVMAENASGILKYLCTYIADQPQLVRKVDECGIVERLLDLLHSSSFTVVQNSLGALGPLVLRHRKVQERICANAPALSVLYFLRDSKRDDLRNSARAIISDLNSSALVTRSMPHNATMSSGRRNYDAKEMSSSVYTMSLNTNDANHPRLLHRPTYNQPPLLNLKAMIPPRKANPERDAQRPDAQRSTSTVANEQGTSSHDEGSLKSASLPLVRSGFSSALTSPLASGHPVGDCIPEESEGSSEGAFVVSPEIEAGNLSESMQCTRSASMQSLNSEMREIKDNSWRSSITTAANSGRQSPESESELPDSPTQCASHYGSLLAKSSSSGSLLALSSLNVRVDDAKVDSEDKALVDDEDFYGAADISQEPDEDLISEVISDFLPKAPQNSRETSKDCSGDSTLSANSDARKSPFPFTLASVEDADGLLDRSIDALITQQIVANRKAHESSQPGNPTANLSQSSIDWDEQSQLDPLDMSPKNAMGTASGQSRLANASLRLSDGPSSKSIYDAMKKSSLIESPNTSEKVRDGSKLHYQLAEDNFFLEKYCGPIDPSLPIDVATEFQADQLFINCREVSQRHDKRKTGTTPKKKELGLASCIPRKHTSNEKAMATSYTRTPQKVATSVHESRHSRHASSFVDTPKSTNVSRRPPPLAPKPSLADPVKPAHPPTGKSSAMVPPFNYKHPEKRVVSTAGKDASKTDHSKPAEAARTFVTIL